MKNIGKILRIVVFTASMGLLMAACSDGGNQGGGRQTVSKH